MSKVYCMCIRTSGNMLSTKTDKQYFGAPNRFRTNRDESNHTFVCLGTAMEVIEMGVEQYVARGEDGFLCRPPPNSKWHMTEEETKKDTEMLLNGKQHYPNVDLLRCPHCGAEIIVEKY